MNIQLTTIKTATLRGWKVTTSTKGVFATKGFGVTVTVQIYSDGSVGFVGFGFGFTTGRKLVRSAPAKLHTVNVF